MYRDSDYKLGSADWSRFATQEISKYNLSLEALFHVQFISDKWIETCLVDSRSSVFVS